MNKNDFEIKNFKQMSMYDGVAFSGTVYVNGKKAFLVENSGRGGWNLYTALNEEGKTLLKKTEAFVKTLPPIHDERFQIDLTFDMDMFIEDLIREKEKLALYKRKCKKSTLFRLPKDDENVYREIKEIYSEGLKKWILAKHPDAIIINDTL